MEPLLPLRRWASERSRQNFPNDGRSVVGVVDKVDLLLKAVEQEPELSDEAARDKALAVAHNEDIFGWSQAISRWLQINASGQLTSLNKLET